ncbi:adenylate kinase isoenzyme 5 isoform X1 [Ranitomeya imitator]|uniref:adenylate kinase isoenzyme 5 isoform X1 n=1 Tax=Ranitomeya imitator TaxID=111125 RepID=UPI0037E8A979
MSSTDPKEYLARREIPQLFEGLLNGLMYYRPEDPVDYLENCLQKVRELGGSEKVKWDTFVGPDKRNLPPLNGGQARRTFLRNVLPESCNFPYRRYDRLPPIHQFSIESDTDLSETAELIEEYEVFDPSRPHPKIILVIGGPGSGKGTQSLKIAERYGFEYISVGELLRKKIHNTSSNRKWSLIAKIITTGELAPQETTITEIKQTLMQIPDSEGIVIDGFPRDVAQALSFEDQICTPDLVVFLACANHKLKERLLKRAEQQGRPDDNLKAIQRRLMNFKQNAAPLVNYFQEKGLIITFDADRDEEDVFFDISAAVDNKLFPAKEPVAGPSELDLSLILDIGEGAEATAPFDDQNEDIVRSFGDDYLREELKKTKVIYVMGGPASGKGTQCEKLSQKYNLTYLSIADLLQSDLAAASERSKLIKDLMQHGNPVSIEIILEILKDAVSSSLGSTKGFVLGAFPCEVRQAEELECKLCAPNLVLYLDCSAEIMTTRVVGRSKVSHRNEVATENVKRRLQMFYQAMEPLLTYYKTKGLLCKINAERSPEQVFLQVCTAVDAIF